jgi:hypothetical protein
MWASIFEVGIGVLAAGVTTTMGFLATKLVIDSMARKLRPSPVTQTRHQ